MHWATGALSLEQSGIDLLAVFMVFSYRRTSVRLFVWGIALTALLTISFPASAERVHVVGQGHTLGKIAKRYNTTVEALCAANKISRRSPLKLGQRIVVPDPPGTAPPKVSDPPRSAPSKRKAGDDSVDKDGPFTTHVVSSGHTLGKIARRYRTSVEAIQEANRLEPSQTLRVGTCLVVPLTRHATQRHRTQALPCDPNEAAELPSKEETKQVPRTHPSTRSGVVHLVRGGRTFRGKLLDSKGRPIPSAVEKVDGLLFDRRTSSTHTTDPGLLEKITQVSNHFGARRMIVVSGYREESSNPYTTRSNHALGRAIDFRIEGVSNQGLRDFCHTLHGVGVGYYPNSTFMHLDVRGITTHWTDVSGPGEAPQYTSVSTPTPPRSKGRKKR